MSELFRSQVVNHVQRPYSGVIQWQPPRLRAAVVGILLLTLSTALVTLGLPYTRKFPVQGLTQAVRAPSQIHPRRAGTVTRLYVDVGDSVVAGQQLATLSSVRFDARGISDVARKTSEVQARLDASTTRLNNFRQLRHWGLIARQRRQHGLQQQLKTGAERSQILAELVATARRNHQRLLQLANRRLISAGELEQARGRWLDTRRAELEQRMAHAALSQELAELKDAMSVYTAETELELSQLTGRHEELERSLAEIRADNVELLVAPHGGQIGDIVRREGGFVAAGSPVLSINPEAEHSQVELWLPSSARGQIRRGQQVYLRINGYPQQEFGLALGTVSQLATVSMGEHPEPRFRARVRLQRLPQGVASLPVGMTVQGDIELETQPVWRWLLRPLAEFLVRT